MAFFVLAGGQTIAQEPESYLLLCKGGSFTLRVDGAGFRGTRVFYSFRKAPGSSAEGLEPGQCSWPRRAINAAEPDSLAFDFPALVVDTDIIRINGRDQTKFHYKGNSQQKDQMERLVSAMWGGKDFRVYVYTDRDDKSWSKGYFKVTRIQTFAE